MSFVKGGYCNEFDEIPLVLKHPFMKFLILIFSCITFCLGCKGYGQDFPVRFTESIYQTELQLLPNGNVVEYQSFFYKKTSIRDVNLGRITQVKLMLHYPNGETKELYDSHENFNFSGFNLIENYYTPKKFKVFTLDDNGNFYAQFSYHFMDCIDTTATNRYNTILGFNQNGAEIYKAFGKDLNIGNNILYFKEKLFIIQNGTNRWDKFTKPTVFFSNIDIEKNFHRLTTPFLPNSVIASVKKINEDSLIVALKVVDETLERHKVRIKLYSYNGFTFNELSNEYVCTGHSGINISKDGYVYVFTGENIEAYKNGTRVWKVSSPNFQSGLRMLPDDENIYFFNDVKREGKKKKWWRMIRINKKNGTLKEKFVSSIGIPLYYAKTGIKLDEKRFLVNSPLHIPTTGCIAKPIYGNVLFEFDLNNLPQEVKEKKAHDEYFESK